MPRVLSLAIVVALAGGCYGQTTGHPPVDGDVDTDADADAECSEPIACETAGLRPPLDSIAGEAEVVSSDGDEAVLFDEDGLGLTYSACGLDVAGMLGPGNPVSVFRGRPVEEGRCMVSLITSEVQAISAVVDCEGTEAIPPPMGLLGWSAAILPVCGQPVDRVCGSADDPVHVRSERAAYDVVIDPGGEGAATLRIGETVRVGDALVRLLDASATAAAESDGCRIDASARTLVSVVWEPAGS